MRASLQVFSSLLLCVGELSGSHLLDNPFVRDVDTAVATL